MTIKLGRKYPHIEDVENRTARNFKVAKDSCFYFAFCCGLSYETFVDFQLTRWSCDYHAQPSCMFALEAGFVVGRTISQVGYDEAKRICEENLRYNDIDWE